MRLFFRRHLFHFVNWIPRTFFTSRLSYAHVQAFLFNKYFHSLEDFMRRYLNYLGNALALASMVLLVVKMVNHLDEIPEFQWEIPSFLILSSVLLFFVVVMYYV